MKLNKKLSLLLIIMVVAFSSLIGCSKKSDTTASSAPAAETAKPADTAAPAKPADDGKPVEVTFWGEWSGDGEKQIMTMVDGFNNSQKKVHVKYVIQQDSTTKFLTASAGGTSPDIMIWDRWQTALYAPKKVLHPIDDFMKADAISQGDFYDQALKEMSWDNNLYGLPLTVDARAIFYNKKFLDEKGVKPPTTWAELEDAAKKLTIWNGNKLTRAGFSLGDNGLFSMYLRQAGGKMLSDDGSKTAFNSPEGLAVLDYWNKLLNVDKVYKIGFEQGLGDNTDAFVTGKVAMTYTGPWMIAGYKKYGKDLDFGIIAPPTGPNGAKGAGMGGFGLAIPEAAKNKEAAWQFEKWWLAQSENALTWAKTSLNVPGNKKAIQDDFFQKDPFWKPILDTLDYASTRPAFAGYFPMETKSLIPNLQLFMEGKQDAKTTLDKAQKDGDLQIAQNNIKK